MINTTVTHYRILEHLGETPTGRVYRAEDTRDGRHITLKFLPYELKEDPEAMDRFMREAQTASGLDHPNIGTIYEIAEAEDGRLFLARAYFDGEALEDRLQHGPMPVEDAVAICKQIAAGLAEAHRNGIVHRDLVPANVLVTRSGGVKLLDFGLAKMVSGGGLTQVGWSLGTPEYMSPEQIRGEDSEPAIDVWTVGVLLYEMVTGRQPFSGKNLAQVLTSIQSGRPTPLRELRPEIPARLERIIDRLLAKDATERYSSCDELLKDLEDWDAPVDETETTLEPETPQKRPLGVGTTEPASDATRAEQIKALWVALLISLGALGIMAWAYFG